MYHIKYDVFFGRFRFNKSNTESSFGKIQESQFSFLFLLILGCYCKLELIGHIVSLSVYTNAIRGEKESKRKTSKSMSTGRLQTFTLYF